MSIDPKKVEDTVTATDKFKAIHSDVNDRLKNIVEIKGEKFADVVMGLLTLTSAGTLFMSRMDEAYAGLVVDAISDIGVTLYRLSGLSKEDWEEATLMAKNIDESTRSSTKNLLKEMIGNGDLDGPSGT